MKARTAVTVPLVIWMTGVRDSHEHGVTHDQADIAIGTQTRIYESICGTRFVPAPMITPPGPRCPECNAHYERWMHTRRAVGGRTLKLILRLLPHTSRDD